MTSIHSEVENQFVAKLSFGLKAWIGGERCHDCVGCEDCDFSWSDGNQMNFTNWWSGEPVRFIFESPPKHSLFIKGSHENCVEINFGREGSWNDIPCDWPDRGRFVCKKSNRGE